MKTRYIFVLVAIVVLTIGGFYLVKKDDASLDINKDNNLIKYSNATYNLSFYYPSTYVVSEIDDQATEKQKRHNIVLIRKEDLPLPVGGEGPTTISFNIYENTINKYTTEGWIRNSKESNFGSGKGIIASTTIGNTSALSFRWSGLYEGTTIAVAKSDWIYVFNVTYFEIGAPIIQDFVKIRDSVQFSQ